MTLKSGTGSACAACKYQRRRCTPTCVLAPYFPADQPKTFQDAHKLFGVRKIVKLLKMLDDSQKADAMNSIIYQAYIRDRYPVHGCLGVILHLNYQTWQKEEELHAVQSQLEIYRHQHQHQQPHPNLTEDVPSQLQLGQAPPSNNSNGLTLFTSPPDNPNPRNYNDNPVGALPISHQHSYSNSRNNIGYSSTFLDSKDSVGSSHLWAHHHHPCITNHNTNPMVMRSQLVAPQPMTIQQQQVVQDYDEMHPIFDTLDDRQSYIDSKEAYESSSDESLKYTRQSVERVAENELKNAAACFSLTSVNYQ